MTAIDLFALQPYMTAADYRSEAAFLAKLDRLFARAAALRRAPVAVAVLPEDVASFLALALPAAGGLAGDPDVRTLDAAFARLGRRMAGRLAATALAARALSLRRAFFLAAAPTVWTIWSRSVRTLARRYAMTVVGGSALLPDDAGGYRGDTLLPRGNRIYNLSLTVGPDGRTRAVTRKVNLVPTQEDRLGLSPGRAEAVPVLDLDPALPGIGLATAICYDAFRVPHTDREPRFHPLLPDLGRRGASLVAQPSANPWPWAGPWVLGRPGDSRTRSRQWDEEGALAALRDAPEVAVVVNALLLLDLWDVHFDGRSAIFGRDAAGQPVILAAAAGYHAGPDAETVVHYRWEPER
ncbi:MAG: hypothetical protein OWV35_04410 [Firmicutes bacterium]|nr:hypothetical protein [Bacillota bacterium]